jgi:hypothetical protein
VNTKKVEFSSWWVLLSTLGLLLLTAQGCRTRSSSGVEGAEDSGSNSVPDPAKHYFDGGTYCVQAIAQGPATDTPVHFSYKETHSDGSAKDFEADLLGDKFDLTVNDRHRATDFDREQNALPPSSPTTIRDGFAENAITSHAVRSDPSGWQSVPNNMVLGGTPWGLFVSKPSETKVGAENVNGYDTIKYTVDTTQESALDKSALLMAGDLKDYNITGAAWILKNAKCVLQYDINYEEDSKDGTVQKTHYVGTVTKK